MLFGTLGVSVPLPTRASAPGYYPPGERHDLVARRQIESGGLVAMSRLPVSLALIAAHRKASLLHAALLILRAAAHPRVA